MFLAHQLNLVATYQHAPLLLSKCVTNQQDQPHRKLEKVVPKIQGLLLKLFEIRQ